MKSSFNWPGRPPAEMISRNVKRLLTSILDGRLKRGAFCTSTLDGTLKRGAFCTSTLDGTPKRGAFCTYTLDGTPKRGAFCTSTLDGTLKRGAFYTSTLDGTLKRGAFCTSILDGRLKRDAFLCTWVGAYCIRPTFLTIKINGTQIRSTKRPCKETEMAKGDQTHDFLSPTGPFGGAYLSTPYHATSKRDAFCLFYSSFLALMQEKKQKKIKASGMPANFWDFLMALMYPANFPALGRGPFLALMQEKKQKKIKASGTPAKFAGYMIDGVEAADQFGRVHDRRGKDR